MKCNQKRKSWCGAMKLAIQYDAIEKGVVLACMAKLEPKKKGKSNLKIHYRPSYRPKKGSRSQIIYLNACPWCMAPFNRDLQKS